MPEKTRPTKTALVANTPSIEQMIKLVGQYFDKSKRELVALKRGRGYQNKPRHVAIYLCQEIAEKKLKEIAPVFGLGQVNSVSYVTSRMRKQLTEDKGLRKDVEAISHLIYETTT